METIVTAKELFTKKLVKITIFSYLSGTDLIMMARLDKSTRDYVDENSHLGCMMEDRQTGLKGVPTGYVARVNLASDALPTGWHLRLIDAFVVDFATV